MRLSERCPLVAVVFDLSSTYVVFFPVQLQQISADQSIPEDEKLVDEIRRQLQQSTQMAVERNESNESNTVEKGTNKS